MEIVRDYRVSLKGFNITVKETDLFIYSEHVDKSIKDRAAKLTLYYRKILEDYILEYPEFYSSLNPLKIFDNDPEIILSMKKGAKKAEVGPFAAVAGAIAEFIAKGLNKFSNEIVVENGGDIFLMGCKDKIVKIVSKNLSNIALKIDTNLLPVAVCSSSSKIGHSYSEGNADLVTVISKSGALSDAFATKICNLIKKESDLEKVTKNYKNNNDILGCLIIFKDKIAGWGHLNIIKIKE
jgi:ApbE superfamily uncharacterized protein (UPF0280 family)